MLEKIGVYGLGLIGGSIALALKANGYYVYASDISEDTIKYAMDEHIIDNYGDVAGFKDCSVVFVCVPLSYTASAVDEVYKITGDNTIITDVASVKGILSDTHGRIVGGHPMAGTEKSGINAAKAHLFENAYYILTKYKNTSNDDIDYVAKIVTKFGAKIIQMSPNDHDGEVARVSHLPHLIAYSLANAEINENTVPGTGFIDMTRIASSDPSLWTEISKANRSNILNEYERFLAVLNTGVEYLKENSYDKLNTFFTSAKLKRDELTLKRAYLSEYIINIDIKDEVGSLAEIIKKLSENNINISGIQIANSREGIGGALRISISEERSYLKALKLFGITKNDGDKI